MKDLTIIIPVYLGNEEELKQINTALESVFESDSDGSVLFVGPKNVLKAIKDAEKPTLTYNYINNEETAIQNQINIAVNGVKTKYFTILETDDTFSKTWFKHVEEYVAEYPDYSLYLPIVVNEDYQHNNMSISTTNEIAWASSFTNKIGFFDVDSLMAYPNVILSGAVVNKNDFIECGGIKESIEIFFIYEFFLRVANRGKNIFVIPKFGYNHTVNREGSFSLEGAKKWTDDEIDFWIDVAKKDYALKTDKKRVYKG